MTKVFSNKLLSLFVLTAIFWGTCRAVIGQDAPANEQVALTPIKIVNQIAELNPGNTSVEFIGTHVGDDPMPRLGGFREFAGKIKVNADGTEIEKIDVEFQIKSIWTEFDDLTAHLMNADFFEAEKFPTATFSSTSIKKEEGGNLAISGNLTMHGETKEITFSARPELSPEGLTLHGKFQIDRTHFGMKKMTNGVEPIVSIEVKVGAATKPRESAPPRRRGNKAKESSAAALPGYIHVRLSLPEMS